MLPPWPPARVAAAWRKLATQLRSAALLATVALVSSCAVYEVAPGHYSYSPPSTHDRAWNAALGALQDSGVRVVAADQAAGIARGSRNGVDVTVRVLRQADGTTRVQFDATSSDREPDLAARISNAYERRMGR